MEMGCDYQHKKTMFVFICVIQHYNAICGHLQSNSSHDALKLYTHIIWAKQLMVCAREVKNYVLRERTSSFERARVNELLHE